jgi:hypothetical protein
MFREKLLQAVESVECVRAALASVQQYIATERTVDEQVHAWVMVVVGMVMMMMMMYMMMMMIVMYMMIRIRPLFIIYYALKCDIVLIFVCFICYIRICCGCCNHSRSTLSLIFL